MGGPYICQFIPGDTIIFRKKSSIIERSCVLEVGTKTRGRRTQCDAYEGPHLRCYLLCAQLRGFHVTGRGVHVPLAHLKADTTVPPQSEHIDAFFGVTISTMRIVLDLTLSHLEPMNNTKEEGTLWFYATRGCIFTRIVIA